MGYNKNQNQEKEGSLRYIFSELNIENRIL